MGNELLFDSLTDMLGIMVIRAWHIQEAHEAVADFNLLGAVSAGSLGFVDDNVVNQLMHQFGSEGINFSYFVSCACVGAEIA